MQLEISHLSKTYRGGVAALKDFTLQLGPGVLGRVPQVPFLHLGFLRFLIPPLPRRGRIFAPPATASRVTSAHADAA